MLNHCAKSPSNRRLILTLSGAVAFGLLLWLAIVWPKIAGYYHEPYSASASCHNLYERLRIYDELNGHLPPATATDKENGEQSSWRIEIFLSAVRSGLLPTPKANDNDSIDYDRHKAWNDPVNLRLQRPGSWLFRYRQFDVTLVRYKGKHGFSTTYFKAITGPGTAFDSGPPPSLKELPKDLILVVRVEQSDTHWMEPGDLNIEQLSPSDETKHLLLGKAGYVVLFADGEGWVLSDKLPFSDLHKFFTIEGAKQYDRDQVLGPYRVVP